MTNEIPLAGYCDSQCPRDVKFIGGQANVAGWNPTDGNPDSGVGNLGACCAEMDICRFPYDMSSEVDVLISECRGGQLHLHRLHPSPLPEQQLPRVHWRCLRWDLLGRSLCW